MTSPSRPLSARSGAGATGNVLLPHDDVDVEGPGPSIDADAMPPSGAKLHRQFHARKQHLHIFLSSVFVLVFLAFLATLRNNGTLLEEQRAQGKMIDSFAVGAGEPTLADRFVRFIESKQRQCESEDARFLVWQGAGPSYGDQLFSLASTFSWALSTGRVFAVLPPDAASEAVHNWDDSMPCWSCFVAPLAHCEFPAGAAAAAGGTLPSALERDLDGPAPVVSFSRLSLNRAFVAGTVFESQSELWITAQLFRYVLRLSERGARAVEKELGRVGWPEGDGEVGHRVIGVHTRVGDTVVFNPPAARKSTGYAPGKRASQATPHPLTAYVAAVKWVQPLTGDAYIYVASAEVGVCDALTEIIDEKVGDSVEVICQAELTKEESRNPEAVFEQWLVDLVLLSRSNFFIGCQSSATARAVYALQTARLAAAGVPAIAPFYDLDNAVWFSAAVGDGGGATAAPKIWQAMQADIRESIVQVSDIGAQPSEPAPPCRHLPLAGSKQQQRQR